VATTWLKVIPHCNHCISGKFSLVCICSHTYIMPVAASKPLKRAIEFYSRILPQYITAALQQWAMFSKEKMERALDFEPGYSSYWSEQHRGIFFGSNYNAFATKFTGFSACHPVQCMMTQRYLIACNTPYDLQCEASYQPPPFYFYPIGKTRASMRHVPVVKVRSYVD